MRCKGAATNTAALFCTFAGSGGNIVRFNRLGPGAQPQNNQGRGRMAAPIKRGKRIMKKFACAALSTALLASMLAACGSSASTTPAASSADTSSDTGASSTEAAASTGAAADGSLHVAMNTDIQTMDVHLSLIHI